MDALFRRNVGFPSKKGIEFRQISQELRPLLFLFEIIFGRTAHGAFPVIRHIFPFGSSRHTVVRITLLRIVHVTANRAYIPVHAFPPFLSVFLLIVSVVVYREDGICALLQPSFPEGAISSMKICTLFSISSRTSRINSIGFPAGSGRSQSTIRAPGTCGHSS